MSAVDRPRVLWRLRVAMAERDIRTVRELRRRLAEFGVKLSEPQIGRIVKGCPKLINTDHLGALCAVLGVLPGDLLQLPGRASFSSASQRPAAAATAPSEAPDGPAHASALDLVFDATLGPVLTPIPKPDVP